MGGDVAIALLAAGRGVRLGGDSPKPLLSWRGRALVDWALDAALAAADRRVLLVVGFGADEVASRARSGVEVVHNPDWEEGIASSLRAALAALSDDDTVGAVAVGLADQPRVGPDAYRRLAAAFRDGASLAVATYGGERANPVLLARSVWPDARRLHGDEGARVLLRCGPTAEVACDDTGSPLDVDTRDDLAALDSPSAPVAPTAEDV